MSTRTPELFVPTKMHGLIWRPKRSVAREDAQ